MARPTALLVWLACGTGWLAAQVTGSIQGTVRDQSQAVIPGASVSVIDADKGSTHTAATNSTGVYTVTGLPAGTYRVESELSGFQTAVREAVTLATGETLRLDFTMELGEGFTRIELVDSPPLMDPEADRWSNSTSRQQLDAVPASGRDIFALLATEPGATVANTAARGTTNGSGIALSVNGARPNQNSFRLDGVYMNDATMLAPASAAGRTLGLEGIAELHLVASPFSAEYGRAAGATFTAVTRSGTNDVHGSLYEYFRDSATDAHNYFDDKTSGVPPLRKNQFGGMLGGPLRQNKLFLLGNYEGIRQHTSVTETSTTLSADGRAGRLPAGQIAVAPQVVPYLDLFPLPNGVDFGDGTGEYSTETTTSTREDYFATKLDWYTSSSITAASRYTFDDAVTSSPDPFDIWQFGADSRYQLWHNRLTWTSSPRTVHNFRVGFSRVRNREFGQQPDSIGPEMSFIPGQQLGSIRVTGLTRLANGIQLLPRRFVVNDYQFQYEGNHIGPGGHNLRYGAGFDRIQFNQRSDLVISGLYVFNSVADFLEGNSRSGDLGTPGSDTVRGWRMNQYYAFVQDEFRIREGLSLSFGVRYETSSTPGEVDGKIATLPDYLHDPAPTIGGPLWRNPGKKNFAPRAAIAWDPDGEGTTIIRAGAGIFYDLLGTRDLIIAGVRMPPFYQRLSIPHAPFPNLLDAADQGTPNLSPEAYDYYLNQPYLAQYQASIQHRFGDDTMVQISYAGSRGVHLSGQIGEANPVIPEVQPDGRLFFPAGGERFNPAFGRIRLHRTQFNSFHNSVSALVQRRWTEAIAFQASYTFGKTLDESSSTINRDFAQSDFVPNMFDYRSNRGRADFDVTHRFTLSASVQIPGPGDGVAKAVLDGWTLDMLLTAQSGTPFSPTVGFDRSNASDGSFDLGQRPIYIGSPGQQVVWGDPNSYFDPSAFALPEEGYFGNLGRNVLEGPGLATLDAALSKLIWNTERHQLHFRFELYNATNHPNFQIPAFALFNNRGQRLSSAGRITETTTPARQMQFAVRWAF